jgi:hypothetical protein
MNRLSRLASTVVVTGAVAGAGLVLSASTAQANPYQQPGNTWCPGQAKPFQNIQWDESVCHTWYYVPSGTGNVRMVDVAGNPLDSFISADIPAPVVAPPPPPPPAPPGPFCTPRGSLFKLGPWCDEIGR